VQARHDPSTAHEACSGWDDRLTAWLLKAGCFSYHCAMKITISLDEKIVRNARKVAAERGTTVAALVRGYLEKLIPEAQTLGSKERQLEALERTFKTLSARMGDRTWKREDLYERPSKRNSNKKS
jgi:hypothetical protein